MRCEHFYRPVQTPGTKVEVKNMNSFRNVQRAIEYEIERQIAVVEGGGAHRPADASLGSRRGGKRVPARKEEAHDYRYFPDPDLPPVEMTGRAVVEALVASLPELPAARRGAVHLAVSACRSTTRSS